MPVFFVANAVNLSPNIELNVGIAIIKSSPEVASHECFIASSRTLVYGFGVQSKSKRIGSMLH
tara:strand:- start:1614 stop:1802 length:189 start_codon:yes stop_codon:yes gene_type:complete